MALVESNVKVKSYLRKGKLVKSYSRKDELLAKQSANKKQSNDTRKPLSNVQKAGIGVASLLAVAGVAYGLKKSGVLDNYLARYNPNGIKRNTKVTAITLRGPASVEEIEKEIFNLGSTSVNYKGVKIKKTPSLLPSAVFIVLNKDLTKDISKKMSSFKIVDPKHIKIIDDFIKVPKSNKINWDFNLDGSFDVEELKDFFKVSKETTGNYTVNERVIQSISKNVSKSDRSRELQILYATVNNEEFMQDAIYRKFTAELTLKERKMVLLTDALTKKYPYIKYEATQNLKPAEQAAMDKFSLSKIISNGYDKANKVQSTGSGLPKRIESLRVSASRIVGPEGDNAKIKYEKALRKYKEENPGFNLSKPKETNTTGMSQEKLKFLSDLGFTSYNFEGIT
jgi:hypothetical protein